MSLQGAGVGVMYLTVLAAFRLYTLLPQSLAFGLLVLIAALGVALALLQNSRALAFGAFAGGFAAPLLLSTDAVRNAHRELARRGIAGGAVYDGLVALAAREHGKLLATRDARARSTYEALGVAVELLPSS